MPKEARGAPEASGGESIADLGRRAATGDRAAFETLYRRIDPALRRMLRERTRDERDVEELSQKAWKGVWEACRERRYDPARAAMTTFVYAVATNLWLRHVRGNAREGRQIEALAAVEAVRGNEEAGGDARLAESLETLRRLMTADAREGEPELTEQDRWVLRASAEGLSDRELAKRIGVSPSTAHAARTSAYEKVRRYLGRLGIRSI